MNRYKYVVVIKINKNALINFEIAALFQWIRLLILISVNSFKSSVFWGFYKTKDFVIFAPFVFIRSINWCWWRCVVKKREKKGWRKVRLCFYGFVIVKLFLISMPIECFSFKETRSVCLSCLFLSFLFRFILRCSFHSFSSNHSRFNC